MEPRDTFTALHYMDRQLGHYPRSSDFTHAWLYLIFFPEKNTKKKEPHEWGSCQISINSCSCVFLERLCTHGGANLQIVAIEKSILTNDLKGTATDHFQQMKPNQ